nr:hypothetical protein [Tanacetum cinerariifolium]
MALATLVKLLFLVALAFSQVASKAVILAEQGFDQGPTNPIVNETAQFVLLDNKTNIISGWSYQGTVWYVIARKYSSLAGNGNGLLLGPNGMISYAFYLRVFLYKESLGKETWHTHAYSFSGHGYVTLQIQSVAASSHGNIACWPIIDDLLLTGINEDEIRESIVKYIDRNHYAVPQGRRAVELISASGSPSGIAYNAD